MPEYTDLELLSMFSEPTKRNTAFDLIMKRYQERLYWHIRKIVIGHDDANDVLQNTFVKVWKGLDNFRADSQLFTWLYRIATNESIGFLKSKRTKYFLPLVNVEKQLERTLETDEYFNGDDLQKKLQKAILTLPEKQRIVFNMRYFDEIKYEDMSQILNTSEGALKASFHIAMKKVEKYITEN